MCFSMNLYIVTHLTSNKKMERKWYEMGSLLRPFAVFFSLKKYVEMIIFENNLDIQQKRVN